MNHRPQLAVFLRNKHPRTLDPLGKPREMTEPDSLAVSALAGRNSLA